MDTQAKSLIAKERVTNERLLELDFAKGLCIVGMILVHAYELILGEWDSSLGTGIVEYLGYPIGAPLFMFCMGMTVIFSRHNSTKAFLLRGVILLTAGQVLNLARYGVIYTLGYALTGDIYFAIQLILVVSSDIMQFAGLAFLMFGLLKFLKLKPLMVLVVSVLLNIVGMLLEGVQCGIYPIDQIFGFFWPTETESYFPFFNWFIFAAAGLTYGYYYVRITNFKRWYAIVLPLGLILSAAYYYVGIYVDQPVFRIFATDSGFCFMNLADAIGCLIVAITFLGLMRICALAFKWKALCYVSKNINKYYNVSYIYLSIIMLLYECEYITVDTDLGAVISAVIALVLSTLTIMFYRKYLMASWGPWCLKHLVPIAIIVLLASIAWAAAGYIAIDAMGEGLYPNFLNAYYGY